MVMADDYRLSRLGESSVFVLLTNGNDPDTSGKKKRWLALILLVLMIVGATVGELPVNQRDVSRYQAGYVFLCLHYYYYHGVDQYFPRP